jgi:nucleoside-diphosphate-sugar epimerase
MVLALVTGAAGFIGRHMVRGLVDRGWDVDPVDIVRKRARMDCRTVFGLSDARYDLVVHAAACSPHRAAIDADPGMHLYNVVLDAEMFHWAARTGQRRVLYLSSCTVLDPAPDAYGLVKRKGEALAGLARAAGVPVTVVRPYSGYGADQSTDFPFGAFLDRARRRADPFEVWGDGTAVRDWVHVDDIVTEALAAVESGTTVPVSICTGVGTSVGELAALMCAEAGYAPTFKTLPERNAGAPRRVGRPWFDRPKISIAEGIRRALHG